MADAKDLAGLTSIASDARGNVLEENDYKVGHGARSKGETPEERFAVLQEMTKSYLTEDEEEKLVEAFAFARKVHKGQLRKSGEPFVAHPVEVAIILADLRMDVETLCAALLHDTKVRFIVTATIGFDHIDADYLYKAGIAWTNCPGCNAASVGQYFQSSMIVLARQGLIDMSRCTVGIVGVGHVGREVQKACSRLGCPTLLNDPPRSNAGEPGFVALRTLQQECDVITFHVPLTKDGDHPTYHMGNEEFFESLSQKPVIINASRGAVIDNDVWLKHLENETTRAAVIDTWEHEPQINPLLLDKAIIATPHIAGYSADGKANATRMSLNAVCKFFNLKPDFKVNPPALPHDMKPMENEDDRVLQLYNPLRDTELLKAEPQKFEWLRGNYPLRREKWD